MNSFIFSRIKLLMNKQKNSIQAGSILLVILSFFFICPPNCIAKTGIIYHICSDNELILRYEPQSNSSIVYRTQKGDYLKQIDENKLWIEVGIIEKGHKETCCGFGWVLKEELQKGISGCADN